MRVAKTPGSGPMRLAIGSPCRRPRMQRRGAAQILPKPGPNGIDWRGLARTGEDRVYSDFLREERATSRANRAFADAAGQGSTPLSSTSLEFWSVLVRVDAAWASPSARGLYEHACASAACCLRSSEARGGGNGISMGHTVPLWRCLSVGLSGRVRTEPGRTRDADFATRARRIARFDCELSSRIERSTAVHEPARSDRRRVWRAERTARALPDGQATGDAARWTLGGVRLSNRASRGGRIHGRRQMVCACLPREHWLGTGDDGT